MDFNKFVKNKTNYSTEELEKLHIEFEKISLEHLKRISNETWILDQKRKDIANVINKIATKNNVYTIGNFDKDKLSIPGVYIICVIKNDMLYLGYVGESSNIYNRWLSHTKRIDNNNNIKRQRIHSRIRKLLKENVITKENIKFIFIQKVEDELQRLFLETSLIFRTKSRHIMINVKNFPKKKLCPTCNGVLSAKIKTVLQNGHFRDIFIVDCRNKNCNYSHNLLEEN